MQEAVDYKFIRIKNYLLFFCLGFSCLAIGQDLCERNFLSYRAEQIYRSKENLNQAVDLYKQAFDLGAIDGSKLFDALNCAAQINDESSATNFIKIGVSLGIPPVSFINNWPRYKTELDIKKLVGQIDTTEIIEQYKNELDEELVKLLNIMGTNDQLYRSQDEFKWKKQRRLDRKNWKTLKKLTESKSRLPSYKEIGFDGYENLEIIFYHMDKEYFDWFLPYIINSIHAGESSLSHVTLYQLDRIGMDAGLIYTISADYKIHAFGERTKMKNGYSCQVFGEWFYEKSRADNKLYETPYDPSLSLDEINKMRSLFCLDTVESRRKRKPWIKVVDVWVFEDKIRD